MAAASADAGSLSETQKSKLTTLFKALDADGNGLLDIDEFRKLGQAITGKEQSIAEAKAQMARADFDHNNKLDMAEWLKFSSMLARLPDNVFNKTIDMYIKKVQEEKAGVGGN